MTAERRTEYLWNQILCHLRLFFDPAAAAAVDRSLIVFGPYDHVAAIRKPVIAIPDDIPYSIAPDDPWKVPFNETHLTVWNRLTLPSEDGWHALPSEAAPLWYVHDSGTHLPAWNLFGNLFGLLTFQEERELSWRDRHGRFVGANSPRTGRGPTRLS